MMEPQKMAKPAIILTRLITAIVIGSNLTAAWAAPAEQTYRLYCVQCHGILGNGEGINQTSGGLAVSPLGHTNAEQMSKLTDEEIRQAITGGGDAVAKSELMPAWGKTLTAEEIDVLVLYLRKMCQCKSNR